MTTDALRAALLARLDSHIRMMSPHHRERESGKLLIAARAALAQPAPPPSAQRVPLTEQAIWDAVQHGVVGGIGFVTKAIAVARAIEAAHGIGDGK